MNPLESQFANYFRAMQVMGEAWRSLMTGLVENEDQIREAVDNQAEELTANLIKTMEDIKQQQEEQEEYLRNLTPEQLQQDTLAFLDEFRKATHEATARIDEMLEQEKEYVATDEFLGKAKLNIAQANMLYSAMLNNMERMMRSYDRGFGWGLF